MRVRGVSGITETKEGRLAVIVVVGGSLLVAASFANVWMANAADDQADQVRRALRYGLVPVADDALDAFPDSAPEIEAAVADALSGEPAQLARVSRPDGDEVVVAVQSRRGWQLRCIRAELRGDGTVLTDHERGPC